MSENTGCTQLSSQVFLQSVHCMAHRGCLPTAEPSGPQKCYIMWSLNY